MTEKQKDTSSDEEDGFDQKLKDRHTTDIDHRLKNRIVPVKPLASGRNRDKRPSILFSADQLGSDKDSEEDKNDDPLGRIDKLMQNADQEREGSRASHAIKTTETPKYTMPVYNAPVYPGPPGSLPPANYTPSTIGQPSNTPGAPTFEYKSAYTNESLQYQPKSYGSIPGQPLPPSSGIPTASYPLPGSQSANYPVPNLPSLEKKTYTLPPSSTRNMTTPESPFTKGQAPQTTTAGSKTMSFKEEDTTGEVDAKTAKKLRLQEAIRLKANLQAKKEESDQQKNSVLTPDQLEEKRRVDQEKLDLELATKALLKLDEEQASFQSQIETVQAEIQQYQQKNIKLTELKDKLDQAQKQAALKQQSASSDQQKTDTELALMQSQLSTLKTDTQSLTDQIQYLKADRDTNNKQLSALSEQKQTLVIAISEDDSHTHQFTEQVETLTKLREDSRSELKVTSSQLQEIRTTGVILDPFLQAKIEEATQKLQFASAESSQNEARLNELIQKLEAADRKEKSQEEESEHMYTDVEVMCQAKDTLIQHIKAMKEQKVVLSASLLKTKSTNQEHQTTLSSRQKYLYDVQSTQTRSSEELQCQQKVRDILAALFLLNSYQTEDERSLAETEKDCLKNTSLLTDEIKQTKEGIDSQTKSIQIYNDASPDTQREIKTSEAEVQAIQAKIKQLNADQDSNSEKITTLTDDIKSENVQKEKTEAELLGTLTDRLDLFDKCVIETDDKTLKSQEQLAAESLQLSSNEKESSDLQTSKVQLTDQQQLAQNSMKALQGQQRQEEVKLETIGKYIAECLDVVESGKQGLSFLKEARLADIAEAIADKLDSEKREAACDSEHSQVQSEIDFTKGELDQFHEAKLRLETGQNQYNTTESDHKNWLAQSMQEIEIIIEEKAQLDSEKLEHESKVQSHSTEFESITLVLSEVKDAVQQHAQVQLEHSNNLMSLEGEHSELGLTHQTIQSALAKEHEDLATDTSEKEQLIAFMVVTDPEFTSKVEQITSDITTANSTIQQLENSSSHLDEKLVEEEQNMTNSTSEFQELQAKLNELNQEQTDLEQQRQQNLSEAQLFEQRKDTLQNQFATQDQKLKSLQYYFAELQDLITQSNKDHHELRQIRLTEIEEAIRDKLDSEHREFNADQEIEHLNVQLKEIQADIQLFEAASAELEKAKDRVSQHDQELVSWRTETDSEHQLNLTDITDTESSQKQISSELQKLTELQQDLQLKSEQFQQSLAEVDFHINEINEQHSQHNSDLTNIQSLLETNSFSLTTDKDGHQLETLEKDTIFASMVAIDPEFATKVQQRSEELNQLTQQKNQNETDITSLEGKLKVQDDSDQLTQEQILEFAASEGILNDENRKLVESLESNKEENQNLLNKRQSLQDSFNTAQAKREQWLLYIQECILLQERTEKDLQSIRNERLQEIEEAIRAKLDGQQLEQALELQITQLQEELQAVQLEVVEFERSTEKHTQGKKEAEDLQLQVQTQQSDQDAEQAGVSDELQCITKEIEEIHTLLQEESERLSSHTVISENFTLDISAFELPLVSNQELQRNLEKLFTEETERLNQLKSTFDQDKKECEDNEHQLFEVLSERVKILDSLNSGVMLDESMLSLESAKKESAVLKEEANRTQQLEPLSFNTLLQGKVKDGSESLSNSQMALENTLKYEKELGDLISSAEELISIKGVERLKQIGEILETERIRQEEDELSAKAASAVQPVNNKRRHARNQSLIGNDIANSTFDATQPSDISGADLELKVKEALDLDSQGQKVTIYDQREESKDVIEEEPNDDDFFSDQMIERKRSSERGRRSSSSHDENEPSEGEPQGSFQKDNHLRKLRWANPTLRHIDECSEEQLVSEYGSEVGGHDFGRTGSGMFGLSTSQRLINKSTKLNQFGVVGPQQEQQVSQFTHNRNESAGSVQVPLSEEQVEEQSLNQLPTVPVPTIIPVARPSETRPSIFDMQRKSSTQGSYRATTYDKQASAKRMANAIKQKLGVILENDHHTEETVLGDLLVCLLAQKQMLSIQSDFEINQGFALFEQMMKDDPKCHEGMFGLGRINYIQGRYELAEKWLLKAYEVKRDFAYRVWLGFAQMQLYRVCEAENPKKIKFVQNAIANLDRCAKEVKVGIYASFGLLFLSLQLQATGLQMKGLQEPSYYEAQIRGYSTQVDRYEGELASAIIKLATNQAAVGVKQLNELLPKDRPHAYYVLIHYYLRTNDLVKARQTADDAFNKLTGYENFQERLMITLLLCKCYYKTGNHAKLLVTLQNQLLESPHFSSLLYVYGKYIIQSFKLADYLQSAISALQECMRVSCQVRRAKCAYWLSLAYQATGQLTQCGLNQQIYVNEIRQVIKSGPIQVRGVKSRINVNVQKQIREKIQVSYLPIQKYSKDVLFTTPQQCLVGQMSDPEWPGDADLTNACQRIPQQRDQLLFRAITLYKLKKDFEQADQIFITLTREHPADFEIQSENANFLRIAILNSYQPQRQETPKKEAVKFLELLESCEVQGDLWANAHIQCAKLLSVIAYQSDDFNIQVKAFECLLKIKNTLPVIDTKIAGVKLPGTTSRYLFEEFDHVDFQANQQATEEVKDETEFKPQDDYDQSNKFFGQSVYFQAKLQACPLATLSVAEMKEQTRIKGDTVFFFGGAQTELAYMAEEITKEIQENNQPEPLTTKIYYRSSTPLICVIKYLQHIRRLNQAMESVQVLPEAVNDFGFCIFSDPTWLYQIAKMCLKWNVYIDLAVHSIQLYLQIVNYYKHFYPQDLLDTKGQLLLAKILIKLSTNPSEDMPIAQSILKSLGPKIAKTLQLAREANNEMATAFAVKNEQFQKQLMSQLV